MTSPHSISERRGKTTNKIDLPGISSEKYSDKLESNPNKIFWKSLLAGGVSGVAAKTLTAPFDRVKILFQGYSPEYAHHAEKRFGVFRALGSISRADGWTGLFQGHSATILRIFPSAAIRFMVYEELKLILIPSTDYNTPWRHFIAGSLAGNSAVMVTYPLEVIRSRLAFEIRRKSASKTTSGFGSGYVYGILPTCKIIYKENGQGLRGFYNGFAPTMYGIIPYAGVAFMTYQWLKDRCYSDWKEHATYLTIDKDGKEHRKLHILPHLLSGATAGMLGQTFSYPLDTIRHRMQLQGISAGIPRYETTWHAFTTIYSREGLRGFFRGLSITYWKTIPANAVAFVVYDFMKNALGITK